MNMPHKRTLRPARIATATAAAFLGAALLAAPPAQAQSRSNSTLYYRMGGGTPGGAANNRSQLPQRIGLGGALRMNYSCGKFDVGLSWQTLMNGFANLGTTVTNAVKAGMSSLPLYVLQRAQPGLYQLFQNYSQKADILVASSLKSCEEMEAQIKQGGDPYEDFIKQAKGDLWKVKANLSGDVVQAKYDLNKNEEGNNRGVNWVYGRFAGGVNSDAIEPIKDLSIAGYNVTLNKPTTESRTTDYSASAAYKNTRLVRAFPRAQDLADFTTAVLGDKKIYTCTQGTSGCPEPTTTSVAVGLAPKYEAEYDVVQPKLSELANEPQGSSTPGLYEELDKIGAPGMSVTPALLEALRQMSPEARSLAVNRLSDELAMQRVVDKALVARATLLSAMSLPQVTKAGDAMADTQASIDRLTHYIDDLLYESKVRKQLTSDTAMAILQHQYLSDNASLAVPGAIGPERAPLEGGRVKAN